MKEPQMQDGEPFVSAALSTGAGILQSVSSILGKTAKREDGVRKSLKHTLK